MATLKDTRGRPLVNTAGVPLTGTGATGGGGGGAGGGGGGNPLGVRRGERFYWSTGAHWLNDNITSPAQRLGDLDVWAGQGAAGLRTACYDDAKTLGVIEAAHARGLRVIATIQFGPAMSTAQVQARAETIGGWLLPTDMVSLDNEPNIQVQWGAPPNYESYVVRAEAALAGLAASGFSGLVCTAGLAAFGDAHDYADGTKANGAAWVRLFVDESRLEGIDGWSWHGYSYGKRVANGHQTAATHGWRIGDELVEELDGKARNNRWATEFGYHTEGGGRVSLTQRRDYLPEAFRRATSLVVVTRTGYRYERTVDQIRPFCVYTWREAPNDGPEQRTHAVGPRADGSIIDQPTIDALVEAMAEVIV